MHFGLLEKPFKTKLFVRLAQIIYYNEDLINDAEIFKSYEDLYNYMINKDYIKSLSTDTEQYKKDIDILNYCSGTVIAGK